MGSPYLAQTGPELRAPPQSLSGGMVGAFLAPRASRARRSLSFSDAELSGFPQLETFYYLKKLSAGCTP